MCIRDSSLTIPNGRVKTEAHSARSTDNIMFVLYIKNLFIHPLFLTFTEGVGTDFDVPLETLVTSNKHRI